MRGRDNNTYMQSHGVESPSPCSNWLINFNHISENGTQTLALVLTVLSYFPTCSGHSMPLLFIHILKKMVAHLIWLIILYSSTDSKSVCFVYKYVKLTTVDQQINSICFLFRGQCLRKSEACELTATVIKYQKMIWYFKFLGKVVSPKQCHVFLNR